MPFTFCHPAIVLPLTKISKSKLSASALIAGSMAPDFEYFLKMRMSGVHGHTISGIFYFNLPVTIGLLILFHLIVRDPLIRNLPLIFQRRFDALLHFDWINYAFKKWYVILYSALIGIGSHLFWDSFTHEGRFFADIIPFLHGEIDLFGVILLRTEFAQLLSSLIGAIIILAVILLPPDQPLSWEKTKSKLIYWTSALFFLLLITLIRHPKDPGQFIATTISAGMISLIITPIFLKQVKRFTKKSSISHLLGD